MGNYAKVVNNVVTQVIVADRQFWATFKDTSPGLWLEASYNTVGNVHLLGGTPLRGNFPGIGYLYDPINDVFIPPKPYANYVLDENTWTWIPPEPLLPTVLTAEPIVNGAIVTFQQPLTMPMGTVTWKYLYENSVGTHTAEFVNDGSNTVQIDGMNEGTAYVVNIAMVVGGTELWAAADLPVTPIYEPPQINRNAP